MANGFKNIYSLHKAYNVAADETRTFLFRITEQGRSFRLKSVYFSWYYFISDGLGRGEYFQFDQLNYIHTQLVMGDDMGVDLIHDLLPENGMFFTVPLPVVAAPIVVGTDFNGRRLYVTRPQQLMFDTWTVQETIDVFVNTFNQDIENIYNIRWDFLCETEILQ